MSSFSIEEKRLYNFEKKAKSRKKNELLTHSRKTTYSFIPNSSSHKLRSTPELPITSDSGSQRRGRPPLNDKAMTPISLKRHKCNLMRESRKKIKITKERVRAAAKRWKITEQHINEEPLTDVSHESDSSQKSIDLYIPSDRTLYRAQSDFFSLLPKNIYDSANIFVLWYRNFGKDVQLKIQLKFIKLPFGKIRYRQIHYIAFKLNSILLKYKHVQNDIIHKWLNNLLLNTVIEASFEHAGVTFPKELVPKSLQLARISRVICQQMLSTSSRTQQERRNVSVQYVINVAKGGELKSNMRGNIELLANVVSCSWQYAKLVLTSIDNGTEKELFTHNKRCDSINSSDWPRKITQYVLCPENSRPIPGNEQVSIRYGVRHPKFLLLRSKQAITDEFKKLHPTCQFTTSTIMREFPQYALTPTSRDLERNTCPTHANARRLIKAINSKLQSSKTNLHLPTSCRDLALLKICKSSIITSDPLTWPEACVKRTCKHCPAIELDVKAEIMKETITFSQWLSKKIL